MPISFGLRRVSGEWRIDSLNPGILIGSDDFQRLYQQRSLYFMNLAGDGLVPDPRYTALAGAVRPGDVAGGSARCRTAAGTAGRRQTPAFPRRLDPGRVDRDHRLRSPSVEVPGASQLDAATRNQLAAQLSLTLQPVIGPAGSRDHRQRQARHRPRGRQQRVHRRPVRLADRVRARSRHALYYLRDNGGLVDSTAKPVAGPIGSGAYDLTSVAVAASTSSDVRRRGHQRPGANARLLVGSVRAGLHRDRRSTASLSRPAWVAAV